MIRTPRLWMPVLGPVELAALLGSAESTGAFRVPAGWPDGDDLGNVERWNELTKIDGGASPWRARAVVDGTGAMVGHAGFHGPPVNIGEALADPTFEGTISPCAGGVAEIGYSIFADQRGKGYASEAAKALIGWAFASGTVDAVIATVHVDNGASHRVLARVGGFARIGTCRERDDDEVVYRRDR